MKICHLTSVHNRYDPRILLKECSSLAKNSGYNVNLVVANGLKDEVYNHVNIIDVGKPKGRIYRVFISTLKVLKKAIKLRANLYHFHDPELIYAGIILRLLGKKVVYDIHEDYYTAIRQRKYLNKRFAFFIAFLFRFYERGFSTFFKIIIAEKYYKEKFPRSLQILNYPIGFNLAFTEREIVSKKKELLYTGVLSEDRGAYNIARLIQNTSDIYITCIGFCRKNIADKMFEIAGDNDRLTLIGIDKYTPFAEIIKMYNQKNWLAGIALMPETPHYKKKELTKFFEYMNAQLPIICSNINHWEELVSNTQTGIAVNPLDYEKIQEVVTELKENKLYFSKIVDNCKKASLDYSWANEEAKLLLFYDSILKQ